MIVNVIDRYAVCIVQRVEGSCRPAVTSLQNGTWYDEGHVLINHNDFPGNERYSIVACAICMRNTTNTIDRPLIRHYMEY